ncbi:MAG: hypothetical protein ABW199_12705, partial [Caulobacterales bacterium]
CAGAGLLALRFLGGLHLPILHLAVGGFVMAAVYLWVLLFVLGQKQFYIDMARTLFQRAPQQSA